MKIKIPNHQNEQLDVLVEETVGPKATVIMAHGIGTNKHETADQFDDVSKALVENNFRVVRFDYAGFGESEGKSEDFDLVKAGDDLQSITDYAKSMYPEDTYLIAQSMSTASVVLRKPTDFAKTVFTAHINPYDLISGIQKRIISRPGGSIDENGVSIFPRSDGTTQKYGASLWQTMRQVHFISDLKEFAQTTNLLIIRPKQDDIVVLTDDKLEELRNDPSFKYMEITGDHSFRGVESRKQLCQAILAHFN